MGTAAVFQEPYKFMWTLFYVYDMMCSITSKGMSLLAASIWKLYRCRNSHHFSQCCFPEQ